MFPWPWPHLTAREAGKWSLVCSQVKTGWGLVSTWKWLSPCPWKQSAKRQQSNDKHSPWRKLTPCQIHSGKYNHNKTIIAAIGWIITPVIIALNDSLSWSHLILIITLWDRYYCSYLINKETRTWESQSRISALNHWAGLFWKTSEILVREDGTVCWWRGWFLEPDSQTSHPSFAGSWLIDRASFTEAFHESVKWW